jgi:hypothetical protein
MYLLVSRDQHKPLTETQMFDQTKNNLVVITGNGLSVAANPKLELSSLTSLVRDAFKSLDDSQLIKFIEANEPTSSFPKSFVEDFEELVGALYDRYLDIANLSDIAVSAYGADDPRAVALTNVAEVIWKINRNALTTALRVIWQETTEVEKVNTQAVDAFVSAIKKVFGLQVTFFTVNYDSLLLESLLRVYESHNIFDLASSKKYRLELSSGDGILAQLMRKSMADFASLGNRVGLFHLHGSLAFWRTGLEGPDFKIHKVGIAEAKLFLQEVEQKGSFRPLVLFGRWPSKWQTITQPPFSLAYENLRRKLPEATHILIAGLSLREPAILEIIGLTLNAAKAEQRKIKILLVDVKIITKEEFIQKISTYVELENFDFSYSSSGSGAEKIANSDSWQGFINDLP